MAWLSGASRKVRRIGSFACSVRCVKSGSSNRPPGLGETAVKKVAALAWVSTFAIFLLTGKLSAQSALAPPHDRPFWRAMVKNSYQIPPNEKPFALAQELSSYLASSDPELRDDLAYTILTVWIVRRQQFSAEELLQLEKEWSENLRSAIGETGTDSVFRRSFSALCLSSLAERELKTPFLGQARYRKLLDSAIVYLGDEKDLRGFDARKGWIHATAHTADLLAALAANSLLTRRDQATILQAIAARFSTADTVFTYGEQDRLANVVSVIAARPDFDSDAFQKWLAETDATDQSVWKDSPPKQPALTRLQNDSYMLRALIVQLLERPSSPASLEVQKAVLKSLERR